MIKYFLWILAWSLICGIYAAWHIDVNAGVFCFIICFALSLSPILACPDNQDGDTEKDDEV